MASQELQRLRVVQASISEALSDIVRVDISHRPGTRAGEVVVVRVGNKSIRAVARGNNGIKNEIRIDHANRVRLALSSRAEADFSISKGGLWDEIVWCFGASNAVVRVAGRLAVLSVVLGAIGAILGAVSVVITVMPS